MEIEVGKEEVVQYNYKCDLCGKMSSHRRTCNICGRDICYDCTKFDPRDMGDYPAKYCKHCFGVGQKYFDRISIEQEKFDVLVEELEQDWKDEAIKSIKKKNNEEIKE